MKIGIDIDEVLASFISAVTHYHNKTRDTDFDVENPDSPFIQDKMKYSYEETGEFLDEVYQNVKKEDIAPIVGAVDAISSLREHELIVITMRPEHHRTSTEEWLLHHFSDAFDSVYMVGDTIGAGGMRITKGELSKELGIDIFIEDSLSNAKNISEQEIPVILLDKPWNQGELNELIHRVNTWEQALDKIKSLKP